MRKQSFVLLLLLLCVVTTVNAENIDDYPNWKLSGFGTFGFAGTDTRELGFYRNKTQTQDITKSWGLAADSRLGLQLDVDIDESLHATAQWIARDHKGNFFEQNLEWAFLRWNLDNDLTLRLGRLALDGYLLSNHLNVGYAYPWMRPPHEFYANLRTYHANGMDITKKIPIAEGSLAVKFFTGYSAITLPGEFSKQSFQMKEPSVGTNILYESSNWRLRAGYTYLHLLTEVPVQPLIDAIEDPKVNLILPNVNQLASSLTLKNTGIHFYSLGAAYDDGLWLAQSEASYINAQTALYPDAASAYLSLGRRFSSLTLYSLYGVTQSFHKNVNIPQSQLPIPQMQQLEQILDLAINGNGVSEQSVSLGLRWDFHDNMDFKAQWSHHWLGNDGKALWQRPVFGETPNTVNVWSFGIDFVF